VYSLTSKKAPEDAGLAVRLLARALKGGFGHELLPIDPDLAPLRNDPKFQSLSKATQTLRALATPLLQR
jgi:hypothetical protein